MNGPIRKQVPCQVCEGVGEYDVEWPCSPSEATGWQSFMVEHRKCWNCDGTGVVDEPTEETETNE